MVLLGCGDVPMEERKKRRERDYEPAMEGVWKGDKKLCHFCFLGMEGCAETIPESIESTEI